MEIGFVPIYLLGVSIASVGGVIGIYYWMNKHA